MLEQTQHADEWLTELSPVEMALLKRLASGLTLVAAAKAEFMSLRTANRRMAELRRRAGVTRSRELVARFMHLK